MLMFTLAISCLTMSNLPWFMDLTFQVPTQYCSLQHLILFSSHIHNWVFFLLLPSCFILSEAISSCPLLFPSSILDTSDLGSSCFSVVYFCLFIQFMGISWKDYWSGLPFPLPVDHILSELSKMTCLSWLALHSIAHSFIELHKPLNQDKAMIYEVFGYPTLIYIFIYI